MKIVKCAVIGLMALSVTAFASAGTVDIKFSGKTAVDGRDGKIQRLGVAYLIQGKPGYLDWTNGVFVPKVYKPVGTVDPGQGAGVIFSLFLNNNNTVDQINISGICKYQEGAWGQNVLIDAKYKNVDIEVTKLPRVNDYPRNVDIECTGK